MSSKLSVAQVLANLEAQMALHKERETYHAQQEAFHREQAAAHAAEYETVAKHYEAFKAVAGDAAEVAARAGAAAPAKPAPEPVPEPPSGKRTQPGLLVVRVLEKLPPDETFGPSRVAEEVNRRFARALRKPMDARLASAVLRRLLREGTVRLVRKGGAHHEALYTRG